MIADTELGGMCTLLFVAKSLKNSLNWPKNLLAPSFFLGHSGDVTYDD